MVQELEVGGIDMSTLESQYKMFLEQNPDKYYWSYTEWLRWHGDKLRDSVNRIDPTVSDDFQIGPDGAYEHTEEKQHKTKDMGKVIIEFDRVEEAEELRTALDGHKYKHFIWELDQKLRSVHKYGAALVGNGEATSEEMDVCYRLRDVIREMLREDDLTIED
jgi:hypothetical protein